MVLFARLNFAVSCVFAILMEDTWSVGSDLGAHVDGYVALVASTVVIGEPEVTGRKADAIQACKVASDAIIRLLQPGKKNSELTPLIEKVPGPLVSMHAYASDIQPASSASNFRIDFLFP